MGISLLHRKESVVISAIEIIDELGLQSLSTREIAKRQGISEGTLFKHFRSKDGILLAVLEHYSQYDEDIFSSILLKDLQPKAAIQFFATSYLEYYENYPAITSIEQAYDVLKYNPVLEGKIKDIVAKRSEYLRILIQNAQDKGQLTSRISSESLSDLISGHARFMGLKWRLSDKSFSLKERTLQTLQLILEAFSSSSNW